MYKPDITIKLATADDLQAINEIYNYYVLNTTSSYQTIPETIENRQEWFTIHNLNYPIYVAIFQERVVGWGSLSKYNTRQAFTPTVEDSIYVHPDMKQMGIGSAILCQLLQSARLLNYHSIIASISADQTASIALHLKFGFLKVAHLNEVGYKFGRWLDLVYMQKNL